MGKRRKKKKKAKARKGADQKKMSRAELVKAKQVGKLQAAVVGGKNWFAARVKRTMGKLALNRLCYSARLRKMTPQAYAEKVLLK